MMIFLTCLVHARLMIFINSLGLDRKYSAKDSDCRVIKLKSLPAVSYFPSCTCIIHFCIYGMSGPSPLMSYM